MVQQKKKMIHGLSEKIRTDHKHDTPDIAIHLHHNSAAKQEVLTVFNLRMQ